MGGQLGDKGVISTPDGSFIVEDSIHVAGSKIAHIGVVERGMIRSGVTADLKVDASLRNRTCQNHSATHLMQKALREVLGSHVEQKGSFQDPERTRFDFSHFQAMSDEEIAKVEQLVNEKISENLPVVTKLMSLEEARKTGAMALFGEKYGNEVRVVDMGGGSVELCGGTHVSSTGSIGAFKIVSESGIAAGVRRIEAITGDAVFAYYRDIENKLKAAADMLKTRPAEICERISVLLKEHKELQSEVASLKSKAAGNALGSIDDDVKELKGVKYVAKSVEGVDMNALRELGDKIKDKIGGGVVVLASAADGKVNLIAMAADDAQAKGAHAGNLIKAIASHVGGGGGGKPGMAQAGGKNPAGIPDALAAVTGALESQLK
jgi:alanyl-tRNA synthetase